MTREEVVERMARANRDVMESSLCVICDRIPHLAHCKCKEEASAALAALEQAIPGLRGVIEGTHVVVPVKITEKQILAAAESHFGKRRVNGAPGGISMTVNGIDHTFPSAMRKMYRAMVSAAEETGK